MSGTTVAKVTGLVSDGGATLASGATLKTRWNPYAGADGYRQEGSSDGGKTWQGFGTNAAATFSKGGLADGAWLVRVTALRGGTAVAGSTSDTLAVRIGPVPSTATPTAGTAPTTATTPAAGTGTTGTTGTGTGTVPAAADARLDALGKQVAAVAAAVDALAAAFAAYKAQASAPIRAAGTLTLAVQGQSGSTAAAVDLLLTPQAPPATA